MKIGVIGSRSVSEWLREQIERLGIQAAFRGHRIITGGAKGTDQAVAHGASAHDPRLVTIYLPWATYEIGAHDPRNELIVPGLYFDHPHVDYMIEAYYQTSIKNISQGVKKLMARNMAIVNASDKLIAFPTVVDDKPLGGTAFGIWYANQMNVPVSVVPKDYDFAKYDICPDCGCQKIIFDCEAPFHQFKAYA